MNIVKTLAILLIVGIGTYAVLLYSKPLPTQSERKEVKPSQPILTSSSSAQTRLFFSPSMITLNGTPSRTVLLMIQTAENTVSVIQIELSYNPLEVMVETITPGDFLPDPEVLLSEIDNTKGRINYALATSSPSAQVKGGGKLLTLTLIPVNTASGSSSTQIEFLPKTAVRSDDILTSMLQSTENLFISL